VSSERDRASPAILSGASKLKDGLVEPQLRGETDIGNKCRDASTCLVVPGVTVPPNGNFVATSDSRPRLELSKTHSDEPDEQQSVP
jgi:hypothetical protein